jgi:hypothetical protein
MPTKNPRLTITIEPTLSAQLRRLSELTGNSQSKLIAEMLEGSGAIFERLILVLEAAKTAKESIRGKVAEDIGDAQARIENQLGLILEDFDQTTAPLLQGAEAITRRARKGSAGVGAARPHTPPTAAAALPGASVTPLSNRGVRSTANPRKTAKATGAN